MQEGSILEMEKVETLMSGIADLMKDSGANLVECYKASECVTAVLREMLAEKSPEIRAALERIRA